jgi:hypothetical protein
MNRKPVAPSQSDKFRELAHELECDEDEEAFKATVKKVARAPKPPKEAKQ